MDELSDDDALSGEDELSAEEARFDVAVVDAVRPPVVSVTGDIDIATSDMFMSAVDQLLDAGTGGSIVFDLERVAFIDSSGLAVLVNAANAGNRVVLRNPSPVIRRVIVATGLQHILHAEP
jgi:anti-anti-sigma factor